METYLDINASIILRMVTIHILVNKISIVFTKHAYYALKIFF